MFSLVKHVKKKYGNPPVFITKNGRSLKIVQLPADKILPLNKLSVIINYLYMAGLIGWKMSSRL